MLLEWCINGHGVRVVNSRVDSISVEILEHSAIIQQHLNATDVVHIAVGDEDESVVGTVVVEASGNNTLIFQPSPSASDSFAASHRHEI